MARPRQPGATGARAIETAERTKQVMDLRRAGASFDTISAQLGISKSTAHTAVKRGMKQMLKPAADELRQLEADRLDALQLANWRDAMGAIDTATGTKPTREERMAAGRFVLSVMDRRAKLLGLDQPQELRLALEQGQVDFMEATVRALVDGFFSALASAGHEAALAAVQDTVLGEVIPKALEAVGGPLSKP